MCLFVCFVLFCFGWLVGWFLGWLAGWLVGWLVGWLLVCVFVFVFVCFLNHVESKKEELHNSRNTNPKEVQYIEELGENNPALCLLSI